MIGGLNGLKGLDPRKRKGGNQGKVPEFIAATSVNVGSGALNLNKPTGTQDGDLLVVCSKHAGGGFFNPPSGWRHFGIGGDSLYCGETLAKVAMGEGSTLTVPNIGSTSSANAILACFRGRTKLGEFEELPEVLSFPSSDSFSTNSRIASRDGLFVLFASAVDTHPSYVPTTPPAGMMQRHTHYGSGNSFLFTQVVKKGDDLSRAMVWGPNSRPITIAFLL